MNTTRRAVLGCGVGTLALLAGCLGGSGGDGGDGNDGNGGISDDGTEDGGNDDGGDNGGIGDGGDAGDTRPSGTGGPGLALVSTDGDPGEPVRPAVAVTRDAATEEHPPALEVTVTNESDRTLTLGEGRAIVFAYQSDTEGDLILLPAGSDYSAEPDCWRLTGQIAVTTEYRTVTLDPGESVSREVELYATPDGEGCLPVGEFRFESPYSVTDGVGQNEEVSFTWGFDIALE